MMYIAICVKYSVTNLKDSDDLRAGKTTTTILDYGVGMLAPHLLIKNSRNLVPWVKF
jgi:hypothetical protein